MLAAFVQEAVLPLDTNTVPDDPIDIKDVELGAVWYGMLPSCPPAKFAVIVGVIPIGP